MRVSKFRACAVLAAVSGILPLAGPAGAQALQDNFWVELSGYRPNVDTEISLQSRTRPERATKIDLESDLDLSDRKSLPAFFAGARLGGGFSIAAEYYSLGRKSSKTITRDIIFDDVTYNAGATISNKFDTEIYRLTANYAFVRRPTYELGGGIGLHATNITAELSGQGHIGASASTLQTRKQDFMAPLPTLGLYATAQVVKNLTFNTRVDFLSLKVDKYDGRLINAQAALTYRIFKNAGLGIGYRYVDYRVDVTNTNAKGRFAYKFHGPSFILSFGF